MKKTIEQALITAASQFLKERNIPPEQLPPIEIEQSKDARHGDFASNIAMVLAKPAGLPPRKIAEVLSGLLPEVPYLHKTEIAGPGFINFFLAAEAWFQIIPEILDKGDAFGKSGQGNRRKVLLEFVSANPTGPIHIGHGRGAAYGSVLANLLKATGFDVSTEYYVNDAGRQMDILAISVWLRYLSKQAPDNPGFPANAYQGHYVEEIATGFYRDIPDLPRPALSDLTEIINSTVDEDRKLDQIISLAKLTLGAEGYEQLFGFALNEILAGIRADLEEFGANFDNWFSERSLIRDGKVDNCIRDMKNRDELYEKDGAWWFRSTKYDDEKDRVVIRENGQTTYFASDIAYHLDKYQRGFDEIIDIWGADHHGYIARVKGALSSLALDTQKLEVLLVQFATLYRGKEKLQMSTRSGEYVTLKQLRDEVGNDATRFFYVSRKAEQHLDFDLELAKSQTNENPVYYVQYAHARICSVFKQMQDRDLVFDRDTALQNLAALDQLQELDLVKTLSRYSEIIVTAADSHEPHQLAFYLRELANDFHAYYNACQFLVDDEQVRQSRLALIMAVKQIITNGLDILGVSAPEEM